MIVKSGLCFHVNSALVIFFLVLSNAQGAKTKTWDSILNSYQSGNLTQLKGQIDKISNWKKKPSYYREALIVGIDSHLRNGKTDEARRYLKMYRVEYSDTVYNDRVLYYESILLLKEGLLFPAAQNLVQIINNTSSKTMFEFAKSHLMELSQKSLLDEGEIQSILEELKFDEELISQILFDLASRQEEKSRYKAAAITYDMWLHYFKGNPQTSAVKSKLRKLKGKKGPHQTILVMAPITGIYMDVGKALVQGVLLPLENLKEKFPDLQYKIIDTEGDPLKTVKKLRRNLQEENVVGIIGPAMSDVCIAVAVELSSKRSKIPMVTPTATTEGISDLGPGIFQLNVTTYALGKKISDYAFKCLNLKEYAILAPNSDYGIGLANSFSENIESMGGQVIAHEYYDPGAKDYTGHFNVIRHRKVKSELKKLNLLSPSGDPKITDRELSKWYEDSVLNIEGLFIAASDGEEAQKLASQSRFHKLKSYILGSSGWHDKGLFLNGMRNLTGVVFSLEFFADEDTEVWKKFSTDYRKRWSESPNKVAGLGYDAALFVEQGLLKSRNPEDLYSSLRNVQSFQGTRGNITMDTRYGYNKSSSLVQIEKRGFKQIEGCEENAKASAK